MLSKQTFALRGAASILAVSCGLAAGAALASGPIAPLPPEIVYTAPAPAFDWAGFYGGLSYSAISGAVTQAPGGTPDMTDTSGAGAFVGYNWQRGNVVFGPELSYISFESGYPPFVNRQRNALELRARAGYAMDNVLFYGFVGAARSEFFGGGIWNDETGISFGLGLQAHVGRNVFVGVEAARRNMNFTTGGSQIENYIDTITLRLGYQF